MRAHPFPRRRTSGDFAAAILAALRHRGSLSRTEISAVLSRNASSAQIAEAINELVDRGEIKSRTIVQTGGRPAEVWAV